MKTDVGANRLLLVVVLACSSIRLGADDLTTTAGRVFKNIEIRELDADSITVNHSEGTSRILLKDFPVDVQLRYSPLGLFLELRRTRAELEKVKSELAAARGQITKTAQTEGVGGRDRSFANQLPAGPTAKPSQPIADLPPLLPDTVVTVDEIVHHYKTDPRAADLRYRKKTFRIRGKVERFEEKPFVRKTAVILEAPERLPRIVCELPFPEEFSAVYRTKGGQVLVGVSTSRREVRLMEIGDSVVFAGRCSGINGAEIAFSQCQRVP